MTRLNTHIRDQIVSNALEKSGNTAAIAATRARREAWAEAVRLSATAAISPKLNAIAERLAVIEAEIPEEFRSGLSAIRTRGHLALNCAGLSVRVSEWEGMKVAPSTHTLLADDLLVQQFHDICAEETANDAQRDAIRTSVRAVLGSVTTLGRLLKVWPEAKELLPAWVDEAKIQLPAVQVGELNALVGLPTEETPG